MRTLNAVLATLLTLTSLPQTQVKEIYPDSVVFLKQSEPLFESKSIRYMEASYFGRNMFAFLEVEVEQTVNTFRYNVLNQGGSDFLKKRVLITALEAEKEQVLEKGFEKSGFNQNNYIFSEVKNTGEVWSVKVKPKRKANLLIDGYIFVKPDGELVHAEGRLVKSPSFWLQDIVTAVTYQQFVGVVVPVSYESTAKVRFAGRSMLSSKYLYTSVNGVKVEQEQ